MDIYFRVDTSQTMGTGHVMRCLVLANALRDQGHSVVFICRDLPGNYIPVLINQNFAVITLPYDSEASDLWSGTSPDNELRQTLSYLSQANNIDWLIVDHYSLDHVWEKACRQYVKKIMVIDDLANRMHHADILLDQNYYAEPKNRYQTLLPEACLTLIGPDYALLRKEFREARKKLQFRNRETKRIMIFLGSDPQNKIQKILSALDQSASRHLQVDIIMAANSLHKETIQNICKLRENYHFHCPANNMAEIMLNADFAIGAGGTTTWERCALGLPSLVVNVASNQDEVIRQGVSANLFDYLEDNLDTVNMAKKIDTVLSDKEKLQTMSQNALRLVDGLGVDRVIEKMITKKENKNWK